MIIYLYLLILCFVTFITEVSGEDTINTILSSKEQAEAKHKETGKTMIIVAASNSCDWCDKFLYETLTPFNEKYGDKYIICYSYNIKMIRGMYPTFWITKKDQNPKKYTGYRPYSWLVETLNEE